MEKRLKERALIGLITMDMRFAAKVRQAASRLGAKVLHVPSIKELPLTVRVAVAKRGEDIRERGWRILYLEDYGSVEELVERAVEAALGVERYRVAVVAIDPGKTMGAAYILDGSVVYTRRYGVLESLVDDVAHFLRTHRGAERKYILIGAASDVEVGARLAERIRRAVYGEGNVEILLVDETSTSKGLLPRARGMSRDEYSALLLLVRNILKLE